MLLKDAQEEIDKRWEATHPLNTVRPLIILDLVTYLLFVKRLDELQIFQEKNAEQIGEELQFPVYTKAAQALRWHIFKNESREKQHQLFTKEEGVISFIDIYAQGPHLFSTFLKNPLLVKPTPILLENAISIVKTIEETEVNQRGELFEYLLNKTTVGARGKQLPLPPHIVKMMVELMEPLPEDVVYDPAVGNGSLLLACAHYLKENNTLLFANKDESEGLLSETLFGTETDPVLLRITAMNLILHGIEDPQLKELNKEESDLFFEGASLVIANPPLSTRTNSIVGDEQQVLSEGNQPASLFYLSQIIQSLKPGGRAAVLLPESFLLSISEANKEMRKQLINEHKLKAVISLPGGIFRPTTGIGADILIFEKDKAQADNNVWFYKMEQDGFSLDEQRKPLVGDGFAPLIFPDDFGDLPTLLNYWKGGLKNGQELVAYNSALVPVRLIKDNDYDLKGRTYLKKETVNHTEPTMVPPPLMQPQNHDQSELEILKETRAEEAQNKASWKDRISKKILVGSIITGIAIIALYLLSFQNKKVEAIGAKDALRNKSKYVEPISLDTAANRVETQIEDSRKNINGGEGEVLAMAKTNDENEHSGRESEVSAIAPDYTAKQIKAVRYRVVSKAYFFDAPSHAARHSAVIAPGNSFGNLKALKERNNFIYVVSTNKNNATIKGWIAKKNLKKIIVDTYDDEGK